MEPLSKIVGERLQARPVGEHPDADLLTAFAEHALTLRERNTVAVHLATCHECRQVVALAAPDVVSTLPGIVAPASAPRFRWPVLRWGALAACVAIIGAAVVIGFRPSHKTTAGIDTYVASDHQANAPAAQSEPVAPAESKQKQLVARQSLESPKPARRAQMAGTAQVAAGKANNRTADELAAAAPVSSRAPRNERLDLGYAGADKKVAGQNVAVSTASPEVVTVTPPSSPGVIGGNVLAPQNAPRATTESVTVEAAPPVQYSTLAKSKSAAAPAAAKNTSAGQVANHGLLETAASAPAGQMPDLKAPKWSLSADGLPQRSFDSGRNWEKIEVDHKTGFRALSAAGMDVWVGGRSGLLYHSGDMGLHWTRIIPVSDENTLSADITHIDFANGPHGEVTTVTGEKWITSDGGKTWQRR